MRGLALITAAFALGLAGATTVAGAGPWLGVLDGGNGIGNAAETLNYVTKITGKTTTVTAVRPSDQRALASTTLDGKFGIPYVTLNSGIAGLSRDGRTLVLGERFVIGNPELRKTSTFTILGTRPLSVKQTVTLRGDFGFDALSPNGRTLYLIQHVSAQNLNLYRVRAYDTASRQLLPNAIADKRQAGWDMSGYPVARESTPNGRWVYTLYQHPDNYPFVHALDTVRRTAVCIGVPWPWAGPESQQIMNSDLSLEKGKLVIAGNHGTGLRFALDTRTFKVTKL